jgi:hypothetical protein
LIDVPTGAPQAPNGALFGAPVFWPSGLVDAARAAGAEMLLLTSHCEPDGRRPVIAERIAACDVDVIASRFGSRIDAAPGAWHVWHFLPDFATSDSEAQALL